MGKKTVRNRKGTGETILEGTGKDPWKKVKVSSKSQFHQITKAGDQQESKYDLNGALKNSFDRQKAIM